MGSRNFFRAPGLFIDEIPLRVAEFSLAPALDEAYTYFAPMKTAWYAKKWVVVLLHAAAWILLFSLPFLLRPSYEDNKPQQRGAAGAQTNIIFYILHNSLWIALFYLNALSLVPKLMYKKLYARYVGILLALFGFFLFSGWLVLYKLRSGGHFNFRGHILFTFFVFLFIWATSTAFQMIRDKMKVDRLAQEKENENLKTELSLLRSQASPHFMFNVLNNMVALARKKSEQLEPSLIKLSSLMRYMLYEADEDKVQLENEIDYLQSYIDLQRQRFGKNVSINVSLQQIYTRYEIEPMLLIPFVENAIKHGTGFIEGASIDIELKVQHEVLYFRVSNKVSNIAAEETKDKTSGIGLANVKRRLNLLYGANHKLNIDKDAERFTVSLQIKLH